MYKFGVRVEPIRHSMHLGLGFTWYTEVALVVSLLYWDICIGLVYNMEFENGK